MWKPLCLVSDVPLTCRKNFLLDCSWGSPFWASSTFPTNGLEILS